MSVSRLCDSPNLRASTKGRWNPGAHGLGNPTQNALPRCQVIYLQSRLRELARLHSFTEPLALWIDTLCIPVHPSLHEYWKKSIKLLATTYRDATYMLVLDRELQHEPQSKSLLELMIRVQCCGWLRRLWTLQEASLIPEDKIHFQFRDVEPLRYKELIEVHKSPREGPIESRIKMYHSISAQIHERVRPTTRIQSQRNPSIYIVAVCAAVRFRSTSKAEDETLCMATLLGLPLDKLLSKDKAEDRLGAFYILVKYIPSNIIFWQKPCLPQRPFRWAPTTLNNDLGNNYRGLGAPLQVGECQDDGLHVCYDGFFFDLGHCEPTIHGKCILTDTTTGVRLVLRSIASFPPVALSPSGEFDYAIPRRAALILNLPILDFQADVQALLVVVEDVGEGDEAECVATPVEWLFCSTLSAWEGLNYAGKQPLQTEFSFSGKLKERQKWCVT